MLNKAQVIGNLGKDPRITPTKNGSTIASFSVATTEKGYTTQNGTQIPDRTEWHNIVCFGRIADVVKQYLHKGSKVFIEGKMHTRQYEANNNKYSIMEIYADNLEMLDAKPATSTTTDYSQPQQSSEHLSQSPSHETDSNLPF